MSNRIYGWFSTPEQATAVYDPPHDAPCLFCGEAIFGGDVRTISLMWADRDDERSYFYRAHKTCHEGATALERNQVDGLVLAMVGRQP